jgi:hypothetical protein
VLPLLLPIQMPVPLLTFAMPSRPPAPPCSYPLYACASARPCWQVGDRVFAIDGKAVFDVSSAPQLCLGPAGSRVSILFGMFVPRPVPLAKIASYPSGHARCV